MSVDQMRAALKIRTKYANSPNWNRKVNAMSEAQVTAIYFRMLRAGELK